jgi:hypothetical protein
MTVRGRPLAPWHSRGTRRLALVRVGLPTLLACVLAAGPAAAAKTPSMVPPQATAVVVNVTTAARQALDPPPGGHGPDGAGRHSQQER